MGVNEEMVVLGEGASCEKDLKLVGRQFFFNSLEMEFLLSLTFMLFFYERYSRRTVAYSA